MAYILGRVWTLQHSWSLRWFHPHIDPILLLPQIALHDLAIPPIIARSYNSVQLLHFANNERVWETYYCCRRGCSWCCWVSQEQDPNDWWKERRLNKRYTWIILEWIDNQFSSSYKIIIAQIMSTYWKEICIYIHFSVQLYSSMFFFFVVSFILKSIKNIYSTSSMHSHYLHQFSIEVCTFCNKLKLIK